MEVSPAWALRGPTGTSSVTFAKRKNELATSVENHTPTHLPQHGDPPHFPLMESELEPWYRHRSGKTCRESTVVDKDSIAAHKWPLILGSWTETTGTAHFYIRKITQFRNPQRTAMRHPQSLFASLDSDVCHFQIHLSWSKYFSHRVALAGC